MAESRSIEQRLADLEQEVARLKLRLGEVPPGGDWVAAISGSMRRFPEFEEVVRLGREMRQSPDDSSY